jgi:hypothetical protein
MFTKLRFLRLTIRICIYFDKRKGEFFTVPKQNTMKLYRELGHNIHTFLPQHSVKVPCHALPVVTLLCKRLVKPWGKFVCKDRNLKSLLVIIPVHKPSRFLLIDFGLPGLRKVQVGNEYLTFNKWSHCEHWCHTGELWSCNLDNTWIFWRSNTYWCPVWKLTLKYR